MFHSDYKYIIDRLPESLVKRVCERLLHHSKDSVLLESISRKSERIESYLRHTLEVYEILLNKKKHKTMAQEKLLRPRSWPEYNVFLALLAIYVTDNGVQTEEIVHDHEEENNRRVMNKLKVLSQHLLDYNRRSFGKFMQDIERGYREQVTANKRLRCKVEDLKMQVQEAEKELASMKSNSSHYELQTEVDLNRQNESRINQLERDYFWCEQEIQVLNREIERLENASEEKIAELKSEISSLKNKLCQAKKDVCNKEKYISTLENRLVESEEQV
ncbi:11100_t:CDS:2 [Dentiscutata erythropus]|uniref:11100_t:CDS:1 n=1 Tax=Dentiscutata erythropus TaxID=1348616 RepID=A0A9N8W7I2_9GLOM|nr:11100_t:CDS:2 [Dentiscutata erythropus]